jgi:protein-S-isoprenylcysteine O-methyltransferase Ste14
LFIFSSLGLVILPIIYIVTPWLSFADYNLPAWAGVLGIVIFAAAWWLLWRSHVELGDSWTPYVGVMKGHELATSGVFRYIRHPMYAAHWLWAIAEPLLLQNWIAGFLFFVSFIPLYWVRVGKEERMMLEHFGEEYRSYMSRTGRVVPRLGKQ